MKRAALALALCLLPVAAADHQAPNLARFRSVCLYARIDGRITAITRERALREVEAQVKAQGLPALSGAQCDRRFPRNGPPSSQPDALQLLVELSTHGGGGHHAGPGGGAAVRVDAVASVPSVKAEGVGNLVQVEVWHSFYFGHAATEETGRASYWLAQVKDIVGEFAAEWKKSRR